MTTGKVCEYRSEKYDLRICCDLDDSATVDITPTTLLCEFDIQTVNVCLNSPDNFVVPTPGTYVDIVWKVDGVIDPSLNDVDCFTHTVQGPYASYPYNYCFEATVTNCAGKMEKFESCISIDPEPVCGTIDAAPLGNPQNLTLITNSPHPIYEICPNNDALLTMDAPFSNCNPRWQYSYTNTPSSWIDLGISNPLQNTNIIPTTAWPGTTIFYRIQCDPISNPSGCVPCYSNLVEIRLKSAPIPNAVAGISQLCKGASNTLNVAFPNASHTYTWYCNGVAVGTGTSYTYIADQSACYWFETSDGCYVIESPQYCVNVCEIIPTISCPLVPNDCACLGLPITLSACNSYSTCDPPTPNLVFTWYIDNVQQPPSGCTITHTPPVSGATYRVEITNTATGCTASTEKFILPCDKQ